MFGRRASTPALNVRLACDQAVAQAGQRGFPNGVKGKEHGLPISYTNKCQTLVLILGMADEPGPRQPG